MRGRKHTHKQPDIHTHRHAVAALKSMLSSRNEGNKSHNSTEWAAGLDAGLGTRNLAKGSEQCEFASTINQALIVLHVCVCVWMCVCVSQSDRKRERERHRRSGAATRARLKTMHHAAEIFL